MIRNIQRITRPRQFLTCSNTRQTVSLGERFTPLCFFSDKPVVTEEHGEVTKPGESQEVERYVKKSDMPLKNVPFTKELFIGRYQKEMLVYPELNSIEDYEHLNEIVAPVEKFFEEGIDSKQIDIDAKIPQETLRALGELGLFGQQIPEEYGGLGLNATEYARIAEVTALDGSIAVTLAAHQAIGLKGILIAGNEEQKTKYLPKLATGEHVAAFCLTEPTSGSDAASIQTRATLSENGSTFYLNGRKIWISNGGFADVFTVFAKNVITGSDAASIQTRATLSEDGSTFYLNGGKIWISNGGFADVFTVFAKTEVTDDKGVKKDKVTAFIVEREFGGITNGQPEDKLGIRGSNTCEVHFDNTPVPIENVIGEVGGGFKIAMNILNSGRFSMGSSGAGILKKLIGFTVEHAITRKQFNKNLSEFLIIQEKFAKMAVTTYAMESMAYLTSQSIDSFHEPDVSVEAAIVKVFSSEGCWECASECLQILGGLGYMKTYPYERYLRDARILMIFEGTNEILRMFISLTGVQYAGKELKELVQKLRNPLQNPRLVMSNLGKIMFKSKREPRLDLQLQGEVHPKLKVQAETLEKAALKFEWAVQNALKRHGKSIVEEQLDLKRLADMAIDIYAMTAVIGRCSRSVCLGLKNSDHEIVLTRIFCTDAHERIEKNLRQVNSNSIANGDEDIKKAAEVIFQNKGYAASHPLTLNY